MKTRKYFTYFGVDCVDDMSLDRVTNLLWVTDGDGKHRWRCFGRGHVLSIRPHLRVNVLERRRR